MRLLVKQYPVYLLINAYLITVRHCSVIVPKATLLSLPMRHILCVFNQVTSELGVQQFGGGEVLRIVSTLFIPSPTLK
jgi:hypothetical protein